MPDRVAFGALQSVERRRRSGGQDIACEQLGRATAGDPCARHEAARAATVSRSCCRSPALPVQYRLLTWCFLSRPSAVTLDRGREERQRGRLHASQRRKPSKAATRRSKAKLDRHGGAAAPVIIDIARYSLRRPGTDGLPTPCWHRRVRTLGPFQELSLIRAVGANTDVARVKTSRHLRRDSWFESTSLQQRVRNELAAHSFGRPSRQRRE